MCCSIDDFLVKTCSKLLSMVLDKREISPDISYIWDIEALLAYCFNLKSSDSRFSSLNFYCYAFPLSRSNSLCFYSHFRFQASSLSSRLISFISNFSCDSRQSCMCDWLSYIFISYSLHCISSLYLSAFNSFKCSDLGWRTTLTLFLLSFSPFSIYFMSASIFSSCVSATSILASKVSRYYEKFSFSCFELRRNSDYCYSRWARFVCWRLSLSFRLCSSVSLPLR